MGEKMEARPLFAKAEPSSANKQERREERRAVLDEHERRVLSKMENIALAREDLHASIVYNPDISTADLQREFTQRTKDLELSREEKLAAEWAMETYVELHQGVKEFREKYPDDAELYQAIFGCLPKGAIAIKEGSMTLYFICHDVEDYTRIYFGKFGSGARRQEPTSHEINVANRSGGVSIPGAPVAKLEGTLLAENCSNSGYSREEVRIHEEQHAWHRLFAKPVSGASYEYLHRQETDPAKRKRLLYQYCRFVREAEGEHRLADEIMAFKLEGCRNEQIYQFLTKSKTKKGLYDYFEESIKNLKKTYADEPELDQVIDDVFVKEYHQLINSALAAFDQIKSKTELSTREIIGLLTMVSVRHWPKIARRREKFETKTEFKQRVLVKENPLWEQYDCVAQAFDRMGKNRHKQKNKKAR